MIIFKYWQQATRTVFPERKLTSEVSPTISPASWLEANCGLWSRNGIPNKVCKSHWVIETHIGVQGRVPEEKLLPKQLPKNWNKGLFDFSFILKCTLGKKQLKSYQLDDPQSSHRTRRHSSSEQQGPQVLDGRSGHPTEAPERPGLRNRLHSPGGAVTLTCPNQV